MSSRNQVPRTVQRSLGAHPAPFGLNESRQGLEDLDVEAARAVAPQQESQLRSKLVNDLKLLFAALGAGGSVVPLGENGRTARLLSCYAASLRDH